MSTDPTPTSPGLNEKPFFRRGGLGQAVLRIKQDETLEQAVTRLRKEGWDIPDIAQLKVETDATGKYFIKKE